MTILPLYVTAEAVASAAAAAAAAAATVPAAEAGVVIAVSNLFLT